MKRADDVFFFTLVDFLLQAVFFGLLLYALNAVQQEKAEQKSKETEEKVKNVLTRSGFSTLTQLTDFLTKLAPVDQLRGWADFFSIQGGIEKVKVAVGVVDKGGGPEKVTQDLAKLHKYEEGFGKPPCLYEEVEGGKKQAIPLATVAGNETTLRFQGTNKNLEEVLGMLGTNYKAVERLPLAEFKRVFGPLTQKKPECRYTLVLIEETRFVDARDAADVAFYTKRQKSEQHRPRS